MKFWKISDGAQHYVAAEDKSRAYGLYVEHIIDSGADWPDEKPSIEIQDPYSEFKYTMGSGDVVTHKVYEWLELLGGPHYFACSDF